MPEKLGFGLQQLEPSAYYLIILDHRGADASTHYPGRPPYHNLVPSV